MSEENIPQTEGEKAPIEEVKVQENAFDLNAPRTMEVEYTDQKFILDHSFVKTDERELIKFYLAAPSVKANAKGEVKLLGQPSEPATGLHDATCNGLKMKTLTGELKKEYKLEEIRQARQSIKVDGMMSFIGGFYDVELSVDSGNMDDLIFDKPVELTATVKTRPYANGKVDKVFKIFLSRPDDLTFNRFVNQSSGTALIDKNDAMLTEFLGDENLAEMTGGADEGERVAFSKTTQYVRQFLDIVNKNISGAENVVFEGKPYDANRRNAFVQALDPILKIQIGAALKNFM